jgi:hypothetical protein
MPLISILVMPVHTIQAMASRHLTIVFLVPKGTIVKQARLSLLHVLLVLTTMAERPRLILEPRTQRGLLSAASSADSISILTMTINSLFVSQLVCCSFLAKIVRHIARNIRLHLLSLAMMHVITTISRWAGQFLVLQPLLPVLALRVLRATIAHRGLSMPLLAVLNTYPLLVPLRALCVRPVTSVMRLPLHTR